MELAFLDAYVEQQNARSQRQQVILARWALAKQTTWLSLLTAFFLMFYLIDVMNQSMEIMMQRF